MQVIESVNNPKIVELKKLQDKKTRLIQKQFLVEGYHLVTESCKHKRLDYILSTNKEDFDKFKTDGFLVNQKIIDKLSTTTSSQGIIGVVKILDTTYDISKYKKIVLLDNINDPGNLGTIIRTSAALGIDAIFTSLDTVDIYNEKVIRATQGSIFKIPVVRCDLLEIINELKANNIKVLATSLNTSNEIKDINNLNKFAIVFGNEANGVRDEVFNLVDEKFKIKMYNDVESLNVAIACAICIYHLS